MRIGFAGIRKWLVVVPRLADFDMCRAHRFVRCILRNGVFQTFSGNAVEGLAQRCIGRHPMGILIAEDIIERPVFEHDHYHMVK